MRRAGDLFEHGKLKLLSTVPVGLSLVVFIVALALPAFGDERGMNGTTWGLEAFVGSLYLLAVSVMGAVGFLVSNLGFDGGRPWSAGGPVAVALLSALANPMFVVTCVAVALGMSRSGVVCGVVMLAGMVASSLIETIRYGSWADLNAPSVINQLFAGYYVWCMAGVVVVAGACAQLAVRLMPEASAKTRKPN